MRKPVLALLILVTSALPGRPASPEFRVELFSRWIVTALTLETTEQSVNICGSKMEAPCWVLPPGKKVSCLANHLIRCRLDAADQSFTSLIVQSATPFRIAPTFAKVNEPPQTFLIRNARVNVAGSGLQVITQVDLESYVSSVLRGEAAGLEAPAARQAMAILARTWALRWQGRHRGRGFDFCSLTHCQVFRLPSNREADAVYGLDPAAHATRGQVLQYRGVLVDPYFTACCGGTTEAAGNVWPDRAEPYLISVHDPYCLSSNHASWKKALTSEWVQQVLREALHLPMAGPLSELSVEKRDSSGRALVLRVVAGAAWNIDANQFRYAVGRRLGWEQIQSNLYLIQRQGDMWLFCGRGLGHGVGLCQAGAEQMARLGFSAETILNSYFAGTTIASHITNDHDPIVSSEHFELAYPFSQEPWVKQTLETLEQWRKELGARAEILPTRVHVATWDSVGEFIRATGQPGWMAASSDGQSIALQPLELLARKRILNQTLRHELTHLVVHRLRAKDVPQWFEEGWVLYLTGEKIEMPPIAPMTTKELEEAISKPHSEAEMKTAYGQALKRIRRLTQLQGEAKMWQQLAHPGAEDLRLLQEGR